MTQPADSIRPFFVYGTLLPNQPNFHLWGDAVEQIVPARVEQCRLYDMGAYPMIVEAPGRTVRGALISVARHQVRRVVQRLDALEGFDPAQPDACAYRRVVRSVWANGRCYDAWLYLGRPRLVTLARAIPDGDWAAYSAAKRQEITSWWETIETVAGLHEVKEDTGADWP